MQRSGLVATMVGACLFSAVSIAPGANIDPAALKKAKALIEAEQKRIWRVAHITVKTYKKYECEGPTATDGGFKLTCTYSWTGKQKGKEVDYVTKLAFHFNPTGGFDGVKDILRRPVRPRIWQSFRCAIT
jgi:hypothetical protein